MADYRKLFTRWLEDNESEPLVRRDQVLLLLKLRMEETDAADLMESGLSIHEAAFDRAKARLAAAERTSAKAEIRAATDAAIRHGY